MEHTTDHILYDFLLRSSQLPRQDGVELECKCEIWPEKYPADNCKIESGTRKPDAGAFIPFPMRPCNDKTDLDQIFKFHFQVMKLIRREKETCIKGAGPDIWMDERQGTIRIKIKLGPCEALHYHWKEKGLPSVWRSQLLLLIRLALIKELRKWRLHPQAVSKYCSQLKKCIIGDKKLIFN
jgi:hypothetical protein